MISKKEKPVDRSRFSARSTVIRDRKLSHGARWLYVWLDDEMQGNPRFSMDQEEIAKKTGVSQRTVRRLMFKLTAAGYIAIYQGIGPSRYEFVRAKTVQSAVTNVAHQESDVLTDVADQKSTSGHSLLITQESLKKHKASLRDFECQNQEENQPAACTHCGGSGIFVRERYIRGIYCNEKYTCECQRRKSA